MNARIAIGFALVLAIGVAIGFGLGGDAETAGSTSPDAETLRAERDAALNSASRLQAELDRTRHRATDTERELASIRQRVAEIAEEREAAAAAAAAEAAAEVAASEAAEEAHAGMAFAENSQQFSFPDYDEYLKEVDWSNVGDNTSKMLGLIEKVAEAVKKGEQPDAETSGNIQRHNGALVIVALELNEKLPGGPVNGAFTHPSVMVNSIASTLAAAGLPLSDAQLTAISRVGQTYSAEERKRVGAYDETTYELKKLVEESALKHRFFEAAFAELNEQQHDTLSPESTRGRTRVDLFSEGLLWGASTGLVPFTDRDVYASESQTRIKRGLQLSEEQHGEADSLVSEWAAALPNALFVEEPDALWEARMIPAAFVEEMARHQIQLMERLERTLDLSENSLKRLRASRGVLVPYLQRPSAED